MGRLLPPEAFVATPPTIEGAERGGSWGLGQGYRALLEAIAREGAEGLSEPSRVSGASGE